MKKTLFILSLALFFASCGSDDDENAADLIIGKWQLVEIASEVETNDPTITDRIKGDIENNIDYKGRKEEYLEDGTFSYYDAYDRQWYDGKFYIKEGKLHLGFFDKNVGWEYSV